MVRDDMSSANAVRAATLDAARFPRMETDIGFVEPGKFADLVALHGDPLADIGRLQTIDFVMKGGIIYKQPHRSGLARGKGGVALPEMPTGPTRFTLTARPPAILHLLINPLYLEARPGRH